MPYTINQKLISEFIGTALLLTVGLSAVIVFWGENSPVTVWIPNIPLRRLMNGILFGTTGCLIGLSPIGKISGAHINPSVSFYFWLRNKMHHEVMIKYIILQMLGAVAGCLPLLLWGTMGKSVNFGNTVPMTSDLTTAFWGEVICTAVLIVLLYFFVGDKRLRNYTPYTMPALYGIMVWAEAEYSGCSTNLARSFGPAVVSNVYTGFWIYITAPFLGVLIVFGLFKILRLHQYKKIEQARTAQFKS